VRRRGGCLSQADSAHEFGPGTPFDALAADYDDTFTESVIGSTMRHAVWRRMGELWPAGSRIVELNCGTGVDATWLIDRGVHVVATDAAAEMVAIATRRGVDTRQLRAESIADLASLGPFDGALSNFGGLNCVADLDAVVDGLAACLRPGATALLCVMGPVVPWEWAWYLLHGKPRTAVRRFAKVTSWRGMDIRYPSIRAMRRRLAPSFDIDRVWALGALVPPSYAEAWARRHPRTLARLASLERRIERWPGVAHIADHYVLEVTRR
jgi:SAM-dependent methyltransferase